MIKQKLCALSVFFFSISAFSQEQPEDHNLAPEEFSYELLTTNIFPWLTGEKKGLLNPEMNPVITSIKDFVSSAKKNLDLAVYGIQDQTWFFDFIHSKVLTNKITLGLVSDQVKGDVGDLNEANFTYPDMAKIGKLLGPKHFSPDLLKNGRVDHQSIMHDKFIVNDGKSVWTGTANISTTDLSYNANASIIIHSTKVAQIYQSEFKQMFEGKKFSTRKVTSGIKKVSFKNGTQVQVCFSPQDDVEGEIIIPAIKEAKTSIDVGMFYLTSEDIADEMIAAVKRGVKVRLIYDGLASGNEYSMHKKIFNGGGDVRVENWGGKMHMKMAVIDGNNVILGSQNWSKRGNEKNDENTIFVENNSELAQKLTNYFDSLWKTLRSANSEEDLYVRAEGKFSINSCFDGLDNDHDHQIDGKDSGCK